MPPLFVSTMVLMAIRMVIAPVARRAMPVVVALTAAEPTNQYNAGGGGGGNFAQGGLGGRPWNLPLNDTNGRGGASYAGTLSFARVFLGGGGGAGGTNNNTADNAVYENQAIACNIAGTSNDTGAKCSSALRAAVLRSCVHEA